MSPLVGVTDFNLAILVTALNVSSLDTKIKRDRL